MKTSNHSALSTALVIIAIFGCREEMNISKTGQVESRPEKSKPETPQVPANPTAIGQVVPKVLMDVNSQGKAILLGQGTRPVRANPDHPYGTWVPVIPSKPGEGIWGFNLGKDGNLSLYPGLDEETVTGRVRFHRGEGHLTHQITFSSGRAAYDMTLILEQLENPDRANLYMPKDYQQAQRIWQSMAEGRSKPPDGSMNLSAMIRIVDPYIKWEAKLGEELQIISLELREAKLLEKQLQNRQASLRAQPGNRVALGEIAGNDREIQTLRARAGQLWRARGEVESALRTASRKRSIVGLDDDSFVRLERMLLGLDAEKNKADTLDLFEVEKATGGHR